MRLPLDHLVSQRFQARVMRSAKAIGLLDALREQEPILRAPLAKASHLSNLAVSSQTETRIPQQIRAAATDIERNIPQRPSGAAGDDGGRTLASDEHIARLFDDRNIFGKGNAPLHAEA